ncbi:MAG: hypothetical protein QOG57_3584, partial [Pseudonocardiales bacterium]|nr:hypothetical protein [Pseudonocardiales bacterium]
VQAAHTLQPLCDLASVCASGNPAGYRAARLLVAHDAAARDDSGRREDAVGDDPHHVGRQRL